MAEPKTAVAQVRAAARLAVQATGEVTRVVERMHHSIGGGPALLGKPLAGLTKLLTAPTYGAIRGVTGAVGAGLDLALSALEPLLVQPGLDGGAALAALNGVVGDFLAATDSPLALEMRLCSRGVPLELTPTSLAAAFPAGGRLLVLVHGSSMEDSQWLRDGHDHGLAHGRPTATWSRSTSATTAACTSRRIGEPRPCSSSWWRPGPTP